MGEWGRHLALVAAFVILAPPALAVSQTIGSARHTAGEGQATRVRSDNPVIRALVTEAIARSAAFRNVVEVIEASDGVVWVQEGRCGHGVRACLTLSVTQAGPNRLLRVALDMRVDPWDLMASLGHELQHAVEVLGDPTVTSSGAAFMLMQRIGEPSGTAYETRRAVAVGDLVWKELRTAGAITWTAGVRPAYLTRPELLYE